MCSVIKAFVFVSVFNFFDWMDSFCAAFTAESSPSTFDICWLDFEYDFAEFTFFDHENSFECSSASFEFSSFYFDKFTYAFEIFENSSLLPPLSG